MKLRLAWLADNPYGDSYSAKESRVILRALARNSKIITLWFALGLRNPPHIWHNIRVFPVPTESLNSAEFLSTLIHQQRPHKLLTNLSYNDFPCGFEYLDSCNGPEIIYRVNPMESKIIGNSSKDKCLKDRNNLRNDQQEDNEIIEESKLGIFKTKQNRVFIPYIEGFDLTIANGENVTTVLRSFEKIVIKQNSVQSSDSIQGCASSSLPTTIQHTIGTPNIHANVHVSTSHLVMRQHLFCNSSWAQVMFELTNALLELGFPTIPQKEHELFAKNYIHREEEYFRTGAITKYDRIRHALDTDFDPETAITLHFALLKPGLPFTNNAVFQTLGAREALYTTGNHFIARQAVQTLVNTFEKIIAPSQHVLRPYLEAGLSTRTGVIVPHGIDPDIYDPGSHPYNYATSKSFKFLQTSFPWVTEKGFDLTIKAFSTAFSCKDDAVLILRIPHIQNNIERENTLGQLERLVAEAKRKTNAPEIQILELDVLPKMRGGIFTGADCYVHPLRAEGFGITILEAMACGLPVIATPWSGPADFLSPLNSYPLFHSHPVAEISKNGAVIRYHVEPELDHLIYLMRQVYEHRDEAKALGLKASAIAHKEWTWKMAAQRLAAVFSLLRN